MVLKAPDDRERRWPSTAQSPVKVLKGMGLFRQGGRMLTRVRTTQALAMPFGGWERKKEENGDGVGKVSCTFSSKNNTVTV